MKKQNVILLSLDEVRPDHLSCYGYNRIITRHIDQLTEEGSRIETCIAASSFTPICMSSTITSNYPYTHTVRNPYSYIESETVAEILKKQGYKTAGFVGVSVLGSRHGFSKGFDYFDEPTEDTCYRSTRFKEEKVKERFYEGNWWVDRMLNWVEENRSEDFFIWGHYLETHEGSEKSLLKRGLIKEGELEEFSYYDAKIKLADEKLVGSLVRLLKDLGIYENTTIVLMADHGANLGEHPSKPMPHRANLIYPQHNCLWDCEIKVPLIFKGTNFPKNKRIKGTARSIDVVPTLLEACGISTHEFDFEGVNLLPEIQQGKIVSREAYAEHLFEPRSPAGILQAIRTPKYKFIRNLTKCVEEFYDLEEDPLEQNNIIDSLKIYDDGTLDRMRKKLNECLWVKARKSVKTFSKKDKKSIDSRLRDLGYIE